MTGFKPTSSAPIHPLGGHLSFHFNPNDWVAADAEASLEEGVGVLLSPQRPFEPLPQQPFASRSI